MKTIGAALAMVVMLAPVSAFAWGEDGHSVVAEIAQHRLTPSAAKVAEALLKSEYPSNAQPAYDISLASIASWADDWRPKHPETAPWHFVDIPVGDPGSPVLTYDPARDCKPQQPNGEPGCVVEALRAQVAILSQPTTSGDANALTMRVQALKFVVHFMGDLSQPLHCTEHNNDAGGNAVHIFYSGPHHPSEIRTNLHAAWDTEILLDLHYDWGEEVAHLEHDSLAGKNEAVIAQGDFAAWANECHQQAVKVYAMLPADFTLTNYQLKAEEAIADEQLAKAGVRLAAVLNDALKNGY